MLYNEITASGLVKVDMQGEVVEPGTTNFGVNVAGFMLHAAIHSARPDLKCVVHVHTPNIIAVSSHYFWNPWGVRNIRSFPIITALGIIQILRNQEWWVDGVGQMIIQ